jgi:hypothetical protein
MTAGKPCVKRKAGTAAASAGPGNRDALLRFLIGVLILCRPGEPERYRFRQIFQ